MKRQKKQREFLLKTQFETWLTVKGHPFPELWDFDN